MPSYTLHTPPGSFRAFAPLIAAEYNGIDVEVPDFDAAAVADKSPTGKAPLLVLPNGSTLFSSHAIARYVASIRRDTGLCGASLADQAAVDAWIDFAATDLELPACVWFYPVIGAMPFHKSAYEKAKEDLAKALTTLNNYLANKTYLVGNQVTLADIIIASTLLYPIKLVADETYRKPFEHVVRWFQSCVSQPEFEAVVGKVEMCKTELLANGH